MGYKLRRQIRDELASGQVTPTERLVLLEIADLANDDTRIAQFGPDDVAERLGTTALGVRKSVQRLATKGIELRIPVGFDKKTGAPVFAHHGRQTNYRIPETVKDGQSVQASDLPEPSKDGQDVQASGEQRVDSLSTKGGQNRREGWTDKRTRVDSLSTPSPQVPSPTLKEHLKEEDSAGASPSSPAKPRTKTNDEAREKKIQQRKSRESAKACAEIARRTSATPDEARQLIEMFVEEASSDGNPIRNVAAFIDACPDEDLESHLEQLRWDDEPDPVEFAMKASRVAGHIAEHFPWINAAQLSDIHDAFVEALKAGCTASSLIDAVNAVIHSNPPEAEHARLFVDAINAQGSDRKAA